MEQFGLQVKKLFLERHHPLKQDAALLEGGRSLSDVSGILSTVAEVWPILEYLPQDAQTFA